MKKLLFSVPLVLALYACGDDNKEPVEEAAKTDQVKEDELVLQKLSIAEQTEWEIDNRLQEPTEDTTCFMCNMKVYTRDHEQGIFSAQAVRQDGSTVFYDDIGCLLNDEYVHNVKNEKFVRDYHTLNWFNVDEAFVVKTDMKSPMNWGYIFFKFEKDAKSYIAENSNAIMASIDQVREEAIERHQKKNSNEAHGHMHGHSQDEDESMSHGNDDNMSTDKKDE